MQELFKALAALGIGGALVLAEYVQGQLAAAQAQSGSGDANVLIKVLVFGAIARGVTFLVGKIPAGAK